MTLRRDPESYRPEKCPCGHARVWCHGCYTRKPDRKDYCEPCLNPVPIPRFYCPECGCTCSVLPECIPPRSWYLWEVRQVIFLLLLAANSLGRTHASNGSRASRKTIKRWWRSHARPPSGLLVSSAHALPLPGEAARDRRFLAGAAPASAGDDPVAPRGGGRPVMPWPCSFEGRGQGSPLASQQSLSPYISLRYGF